MSARTELAVESISAMPPPPASLAILRRPSIWPKSSSAANYYVITGLGGALGLAKALAYAKVLGSAALGLYALGVVFSAYWQICAELGICRGLECRLPVLYGAGRHDEGHGLRNHVAAQLALLAGLFLPALAIVCLAPGPLADAVDWTPRLTFFLSGVMSTATLFVGMVAVDLRSRGGLAALGWLGLGRTLGNIVFGVFAGVLWGVPGLLAAETCVALAAFGWYAMYVCEDFRFQFRGRAATVDLLRIGLPMAGRNLVNAFGRSLDRWIVSATIGLAAFGQYAFAALVVTAADVLFASVWSHVGPAATRRVGRDGDLGVAFRSLARYSLGLAFAAVVGWLPFVWLSDAIVDRWFPQYREGASIMALLYWGGALELIALFDWIPMAAQRTRPLLVSTLLTTLIVVVCYFLAMQGQAGAIHFAWLFVAGRAVHFLGQIAVALAIAIEADRDGRARIAERS